MDAPIPRATVWSVIEEGEPNLGADVIVAAGDEEACDAQGFPNGQVIIYTGVNGEILRVRIHITKV